MTEAGLDFERRPFTLEEGTRMKQVYEFCAESQEIFQTSIMYFWSSSSKEEIVESCKDLLALEKERESNP